MNYKNIIKKLFWGLFILTFGVYFIFIYSVFNELSINFMDSNILKIIISLVIALVFDCLSYWMYIITFLATSLGKKKSYKEKLSEIDFKNKEGYFRNILENYNPLELSYIDAFKLDFPKDIIAMLLHLNKKGIIEFNKEKGIIEYNENLIKLSESESFVLKFIKNGKINFNEFDLESHLGIIKESCVSHNLLKNDDKKLSGKGLIIIILLYFVSFYLIFKLEQVSFLLSSILTMVVAIIPFIITFYIIYLIAYSTQKFKNPYVRSELGEEVNKKLEGLKNFLKDFSSLEEKNIEELILWEDYLVYSVLFNQNKKIINEIYNTYFIK